MPRSSGLSVKKPVSVWNREVKVNFRDLFKALGKAVVSAKVGKFDLAINSLVDSVAAFELKKDAGQMAWLLIYRSISRAMFMLIEDNLLLIREATRGFQSLAGQVDLSEENLKAIADKLDYAVDARDLTIDRNFFERPREFPVIEDLKKTLAHWLGSFDLNSAQTHSIIGRFPSYFVFALNDEWRARRLDYTLITEEISTPFTEAAVIEQAWSHYYAWLQKRVDEPLFQEAFSLRQIYIPLRAYFEEKKEEKRESSFDEEIQINFIEKPETDSREVFENYEQAGKTVEKVIVDLEQELQDWIDDTDERQAIRIISGGPGYGKSSVARMFAARQTAKSDRRVLFIPLHLFEPTDDLVDSVRKFVESEGFFPPFNPLHTTEGEKRLLLIFDGLDELSMQGKVGNEVAQQFVKEVQRKVDILNLREPRLKILICGRDIAVQAGAVNLDRKTKILHLLPYVIPNLNLPQFAGKRTYTYERMTSFLTKDQRDDWWINYGKVSGKNYGQLPKELKQENLAEITAMPLLNYLVALSYTRGKIDFSRENNLNAIYRDLLESVYQRENVWAEKQHPMLKGIGEEDFFRIFEEIALVAWHSGEARKVTVKEIEEHCERSGLKPLLEKFQEKAKDGVSSLLVAFYFKKSGVRDEELNETFEFTHKSFGEYLTARRIIRGVKRIDAEIKRRRQFYESGWDEVEALTYWIQLCGSNAIDQYLLRFIRDEIALESHLYGAPVADWQMILGKLFTHVLHHGMPMEKLADKRPGFKEETRQAQNAEAALMATLNACARATKQISNIEFPDEERINLWLHWTYLPIYRDILSFLNLRKRKFERANFAGANFEATDLHQAELRAANLQGAYLTNANLYNATLYAASLSEAICYKANLEGAKLGGANLQKAKLEKAELSGANLQSADLRGTSFVGAILIGATLESAIFGDTHFENANLSQARFGGVNLEKTRFHGANLEGAYLNGAKLRELYFVGVNFQGASLQGANLFKTTLSGANLYGANLQVANLEGTNLENANLQTANLYGAKLDKANLQGAKLDGAKLDRATFEGATWTDGRRILSGSYPDFAFESHKPKK